MWTTVVLLGLMVSIEPTRLGLIALLLTRQHPIRHLVVFQCVGLSISLTVGLTVLFVFHRSFLGNSNIHPAPLQVAFGVVLVLLGAVLASKIPLDRFARQPKDKVPAGGGDDAVVDDAVVDDVVPPVNRRTRFFARVRGFLKSESSAFSASIGAATAMPSIDYFALLAIIIASSAPPLEQGLALLTFLLLAGAFATIPMLSFIVAPVKTRLWVQQVNLWVRSRTRKQAGLFVGTVGVVLIAVGLIGL
ncbi:GAP family protein [Mycobacterium frederiksbergense]|uniref:GAP family protein n=1 Tax=Mycolicibacterium frederiksbergense TaxID=117567 RepID=UPI0021F387EF|nr:GAP family protein [Mycolicibacterium frederiksbergense]MCV7048132.1 GAP family protein [Mycolicibacterium frederiksbergense]